MRPGQIIYARIELLSLVSLVIEVLRIFQATENLFHFFIKAEYKRFCLRFIFCISYAWFLITTPIVMQKSKEIQLDLKLFRYIGAKNVLVNARNIRMRNERNSNLVSSMKKNNDATTSFEIMQQLSFIIITSILSFNSCNLHWWRISN